MVQRWANPDDSDGEWVVEETDGVRGPPANRFWKLRWVPYTDEETAVHEQARNSGAQDDGSYVHGWQPGDNCQRIVQARVKEKAAVATPAVEAAARMAKAEGSAGGTTATTTAASRGDDGDDEGGQQGDGGDDEGGQKGDDGDGEGGQQGGRWYQHMTTTETTTTAATTATTTTTTTMKTTTRREETKAETSTDSVPSPCKADLLHRGG